MTLRARVRERPRLRVRVSGEGLLFTLPLTSPSPSQWAEKRDQEQFPIAKLLLGEDYVHYVGSNKL